MRAPWSSRWNSSNTARCRSAGMPSPVSHTSMLSAPGTRRQPTRTLPATVYLTAFETRFCRRRRIRRRSVRIVSRVGTTRSCKPLRERERRELDLEHAHEIGDRRVGELRPGRAGVEAGDVEQRAENLLDRLERHVDLAREIGAVVAASSRALGERARIEAGGVQRLENVVAGRGEEARLGDVRVLGDGLGAGELGVQALQFGGALVDPLLQELVGRLERLLGLNGLGDVGVGGDDAAVGEPGRADLDHAVGGEEPEARRLVVVEERGDALGDEVLGIAGAVGAAARR